MNAVAAVAATTTESCGSGAGRGAFELQSVTASDFAAAMQRVGPSMARGAAMEVDPVRCEWHCRLQWRRASLLRFQLLCSRVAMPSSSFKFTCQLLTMIRRHANCLQLG